MYPGHNIRRGRVEEAWVDIHNYLDIFEEKLVPVLLIVVTKNEIE